MFPFYWSFICEVVLAKGFQVKLYACLGYVNVSSLIWIIFTMILNEVSLTSVFCVGASFSFFKPLFPFTPLLHTTPSAHRPTDWLPVCAAQLILPFSFCHIYLLTIPLWVFPSNWIHLLFSWFFCSSWLDLMIWILHISEKSVKQQGTCKNFSRWWLIKTKFFIKKQNNNN